MKNSFLLILTFIYSMGQAQTKIIAHRGFSAVAPENTITAFQKAIDIGADYFELDVHVSIEGKPVVIHDATLDKTTSSNSSGKVDDMNFRELLNERVGYPAKFGDLYSIETLPSLKQALELAQNKIKVCIEIKVENANEEIYKVITDLEMQDEVIIFSFYPSVVKAFRELDANIQTLFLITQKNKNTIQTALDLGVNAIGLGPLNKISKKYLKKAHHAKLEIWKWTINNPKKMQKLMALPIDGLITNHPDKAITFRK